MFSILRVSSGTFSQRLRLYVQHNQPYEDVFGKKEKAMKKNKRLSILLAGIVLISIAFLLLNFRVAMSNTQAEKLIAVLDPGAANMPVSMQRNDKIDLLLVGEGPLVGALQKVLTEKVEEVGIAEIKVVQELEPANKNPLLVVRVDGPGSIWTPFLAVSKFSVHAGYASNGDPAFMEVIEKTRTSVAQKDAANMYAELDVSDYSLGLISRLGYHQFLADYIAQEIVTALKDLYNV